MLALGQGCPGSLGLSQHLAGASLHAPSCPKEQVEGTWGTACLRWFGGDPLLMHPLSPTSAGLIASRAPGDPSLGPGGFSPEWLVSFCFLCFPSAPPPCQEHAGAARETAGRPCEGSCVRCPVSPAPPLLAIASGGHGQCLLVCRGASCEIKELDLQLFSGLCTGCMPMGWLGLGGCLPVHLGPWLVLWPTWMWRETMGPLPATCVQVLTLMPYALEILVTHWHCPAPVQSYLFSPGGPLHSFDPPPQ